MSAATTAGGAVGTAPSLEALGSRIDNSYVRDLRPDPDAKKNEPNWSPREVLSGHYVRVAPTPLRAPYLVAFSRDLADTLGISHADCESSRFVRTFSGDLEGAAGFDSTGWATPYALSIYGRPQLPPGSGPSGNGYGDGRAISIAEVLLLDGVAAAAEGRRPAAATAPRMELQLKGGGRTPFCRGADGCAVLRSSAREFLASEAMHHLGVPTTRALCLLASAAPEEAVVRQWYAPALRGGCGTREVLASNRRAITTRAASSFLRVGQFELYGRRAARGDATGRAELELLARHALAREFPVLVAPAPDAAAVPLQPALLAMLREVSARLAALAAAWLRVGYVQGNFNGDNCLVGGVTMDYGPFGFMERYDPRWGMWVGAGAHFAFANQPAAAAANFGVLVASLEPLLDAAGVAEARRVLAEHAPLSAAAVAAMWARKLGFPPASPPAAAAPLWARLEGLMATHPTDFTILFRQLAAVAEGCLDGAAAAAATTAAAAAPDAAAAAALLLLLAPLEPAFYAPLPRAVAAAWRGWLDDWLAALRAAGRPAAEAAAAMRAANPKFVSREWLLVEAYTAAERGDHAPLLALQALLERPYDEQPDAPARYYSRAPPGADEQGGTGFMTCSS